MHAVPCVDNLAEIVVSLAFGIVNHQLGSVETEASALTLSEHTQNWVVEDCIMAIKAFENFHLKWLSRCSHTVSGTPSAFLLAHEERSGSDISFRVGAAFVHHVGVFQVHAGDDFEEVELLFDEDAIR